MDPEVSCLGLPQDCTATFRDATSPATYQSGTNDASRRRGLRSKNHEAPPAVLAQPAHNKPAISNALEIAEDAEPAVQDEEPFRHLAWGHDVLRVHNCLSDRRLLPS